MYGRKKYDLKKTSGTMLNSTLSKLNIILLTVKTMLGHHLMLLKVSMKLGSFFMRS